MTDTVIQVQGLQKHYGTTHAVRGIDFTVQRGEIFGLIGPDGAGKTTTFQILAGVMEASEGRVEVLHRPPRDARLGIGYLTQQFSLYLDLSIDENIRYSAGLREVPPDRLLERRDRYLKLMSLEQFGSRLAGQLSGGMKQKLALCCALVSQPEILLLDEPTTGVDPVSRREFWDVLATLSSQGVTIVVATPYLDEAERCNRIALMYEGEIQQVGTLQQLRQNLGLHRLELRTDYLEQTEAVLLKAIHHAKADSNAPSSLVDVQTFGDRLDVLVCSPDQSEAEVRHLLAQERLTLTDLQPVEATLENVFVTRLRQQGADPPFISFPRTRQDLGRSPTSSSSENHIAIKTNHLSKTFGNFQAVRDVTLEVRYGEIYGLLGANGAGKTTTIKMLCGLLAPSGGEMMLAGRTQDLRNTALRQRIGYMSQKFTLYDDLSVVQNLEFYCGVYGVPRHQRREKIDWVLAICGLEGQEDMLTGRLPGGWKQRVSFGASVMHEPEILFLDEPTSGVDPLARRQFWRLIEDFARRGTAILVTTHYLEEAEHCNYLGFLVAGEVMAQGSPSQIKAQQPGQLIELVTNHTQTASDLLKTQLDPWRVSIFGDRLHLVLDHPDTELPHIRDLLDQTPTPNGMLEIHSLRPVPFSLEDTFIGIVERAQSKVSTNA
ncbi:ABC transporter ATP-binding protein [Oscillatoria sp. FACHB-1407]|uniref:ATP-binding cassette domain-containing protein n=1 Tax=Oscillatoria sp. FACHB-1407 TaxID=2692847 RepID=UPI0016872F2A|nr:ATP-binding cassette domain-containing protein [Oscillatoria sp. FACHB-1407]MBD2461105.1 ABC transporter ATP-binding protein [Oscillatoria sp. FACHB-1407]